MRLFLILVGVTLAIFGLFLGALATWDSFQVPALVQSTGDGRVIFDTGNVMTSNSFFHLAHSATSIGLGCLCLAASHIIKLQKHQSQINSEPPIKFDEIG